ncbi:MAG: hypothetical protein ACK59Y_08830 [Betaproteobacteria bacterium]|nr:hypothetical protein [Betaproteobacteria bacterium]
MIDLRSRSALAIGAVRQFPELNQWQSTAISKGERQAEAGHFIDNAQQKKGVASLQNCDGQGSLQPALTAFWNPSERTVRLPQR